MKNVAKYKPSYIDTSTTQNGNKPSIFYNAFDGYYSLISTLHQPSAKREKIFLNLYEDYYLSSITMILSKTNIEGLIICV